MEMPSATRNPSTTRIAVRIALACAIVIVLAFVFQG